MRTWAQRTARWTARTLPFSFGRGGGRDVAAASPALLVLIPAQRTGDHTTHQPLHARGAVAPARGKHAAASPRRMRPRDLG